MKRLRAIAESQGTDLVTTEGANHTKVWIGDRQNVVARHNEINDITARKIIRHFTRED
ncbi:MAG: hypothetical protein ACRCSN_18330 [Dermatophilaceae bacterium]